MCPPRTLTGRARALIVMVVLVLAVPATAGATQDDEPRLLPDIDVLRDDDTLHPSVNALAIESEDFDAAVTAYLEQQAIFDAAEQEVDIADAALADLRDDRAVLEAELTALVADADLISALAVQERQDLREVALNAFMDLGASTATDTAGALDADIYLEREHRAVLFDTAQDSTQQSLRALEDELAELQEIIGEARFELADIVATIGRFESLREQAIRRGFAAALQFEDLAADIIDHRFDATIVGTDIPVLALDAYVRAAATLEDENEDCGVDWSLLAGVGKTESNHGLFGGSELEVGGDTTKPILGVPLDGEQAALIVDTDGGVLDGNTEFDRALGPMQFIPETWKNFGRDGTDDGENDPHNIYDAALAAAHYLCSSAAEVTTPAGRTSALLTYNQSEEYGILVQERAEAYSELEIPDVKVPQNFAANG